MTQPSTKKPGHAASSDATGKARRGLRPDGESTRNRILEAAGELFAASGFAETSSKAVAARAEVNIASINYHFGGHAGLYQAVLIEAHRRVIDLAKLRQLSQAEGTAAARLCSLIDLIVAKAVQRRPGWHARVLAREMLSPSTHLRVLLQSEVQPKFLIVQAIVSEITGIPAEDPALLRCTLSVFAPCLVMLIGLRGVPSIPQEVRKMPRQDIAAHLQRFALAGLKAIGREHAGKASVEGDGPKRPARASVRRAGGPRTAPP